VLAAWTANPASAAAPTLVGVTIPSARCIRLDPVVTLAKDCCIEVLPAIT